jgi:hypothetical protein
MGEREREQSSLLAKRLTPQIQSQVSMGNHLIQFRADTGFGPYNQGSFIGMQKDVMDTQLVKRDECPRARDRNGL